MESSAYDLGRILTEQFELPNLQDKGKKRSLSRYTYDLTDRNRGFGQVLDKKATLRRILETNIGLGRVGDVGAIDPTGLVITPHDKIYRILSKEMDYESQAMVFFLRDYSGSMTGKPTELVCAQHVLIYSWLLYQYDRQVETRFILHDTEAKEVPDFYTYYNSKVAGGTKVASAFRMVNEIVETQGLARDYNIYVFHGTDGDDWDTEGKETVSGNHPHAHLCQPRRHHHRRTRRRCARRKRSAAVSQTLQASRRTTEADPARRHRTRNRRSPADSGNSEPDFMTRRSIGMELIDQHTKRIMEGCKDRARAAGLRFEDETLEYIVTNRDLLELSPKVMIPTLYDYWVHDVEVLRERGKYELYPHNPYETVINTRPAISFYNDNNPDWLNVMIFYHVLAHIDFFQNNLFFRHTWDYDFTGKALSDKRLVAKLRSEKGRWVDYAIEFSRGIDNLVGYHSDLSRIHRRAGANGSARLDYYFDVFLQEIKKVRTGDYIQEIERYNRLRQERGALGEKAFFAEIERSHPEFEAMFEKKPGNAAPTPARPDAVSDAPRPCRQSRREPVDEIGHGGGSQHLALFPAPDPHEKS